MKKSPERVYILIDNNYKEISYEEFNQISGLDKHYFEKHHFVLVHGKLLEVFEKDWKELHRERNRIQYLQKLDKQNKILSIDAFDSEDDNGTDYIADTSSDIAEQIADKMLIENMMKCLYLLPYNERLIIHELYFNGLSERKLADKQGIPKSSVNYQKLQILKKLKKFLEN